MPVPISRTCIAAVRVASLFVTIPPLTACGPGGPIASRLRPEVVRPQRGVVLFICDGLHRGLVEQGCREGWLPNIQNRLVARGVTVEHAVSEMPSITYPNLATFATGLIPGRHGILGNSWFNPDAQFFRDYKLIKSYRAVNQDFVAPTVYELLHPAATASVQSPVIRGLTRNFGNWAVSGVMWFFGDYTAVDKLTATTMGHVAAWANARRVWPTLLTCYFPGVDTVGHRLGPEGPNYRRAVKHFDYQFGRVCDWLEREQLLETTTIVLVSDHGMVSCQPGGQVDLHGYVGNVLGRHVARDMLHDAAHSKRAGYYEQFDAVVVDKGVRFASIHLRGTAGWGEAGLSASAVALLLEQAPPGQRLWELPGVDLVGFVEPSGAVRLQTKRGQSRIWVSRRTAPPATSAAANEEFEYRYDAAPDDALGYLDDAELASFVAAGKHAEREWLAAARNAEFPAVVAQLPRLLQSRIAGQVAVFASSGYSFCDQAGGHGGIHRDEVLIPMMFAGPDLPPGTAISLARAADLVPTILGLAGRPPEIDDDFDGVSLFQTAAHR